MPGWRRGGHILVCGRRQSDGHTSLHKVGWGSSLWNKIAGGFWKEVLGREPGCIVGLWVCVWLAAVGLGEARNSRTEAGSRMEARAMRLRQGEVIRQWGARGRRR